MQIRVQHRIRQQLEDELRMQHTARRDDALRAFEKEQALEKTPFSAPAYWTRPEPQTWECACELEHAMTTTPFCPHGGAENYDRYVEDLGLLVKDAYADGGYTCQQAALMLQECTTNLGCTCPVEGEFETENLSIFRIENHAMWQRFCFHEKQVEKQIQTKLAGFTEQPPRKARKHSRLFESHDWLRKLEEKNLSGTTRYLLHGTRASNLDNIVQHGLRTKFTKSASSSAMYGTGLYFTNSACKAWQYTDRGLVDKKEDRAIILLCRVVLGKTEQLATRPKMDVKNFPKLGYHIKMAVHGYTRRPAANSGQPSVQVHDEFMSSSMNPWCTQNLFSSLELE
ncbi:hypothetical protein T492DRAFT_832025 [Pavlovales sp. CCMP2436]|nr:hypothetical protein T492DRAFT_832025 [Pavlovales sp. CCMP2436]